MTLVTKSHDPLSSLGSSFRVEPGTWDTLEGICFQVRHNVRVSFFTFTSTEVDWLMWFADMQ